VKASETIRRFISLWLISSFLSAIFAAYCFSPADTHATETVILTVSLNTVSQGEFFLKRGDDGGLLMRSEDLRHIGLKITAVPIKTVDNESYTPLKELTGVTATLDEKLLTLDLRAGAAWVDLPVIIQNFSPSSARNAPSSRASAFLNYRVDYSNSIDKPAATWSATGQSGLRRGNLLLLGDGFYQRTENTQQAVRLMTNLSWDRPKTTSRWVAGDINATAGEPSGPVIMGGLGYSSAYSMSPGLVTYPLGEFGGVATLPSEAYIYVNGVLVRRERLAPGDYRFRNLPVSNGVNNVEVVLRDSFGNENRNITSFYLSDRLFKAGLHDYSYNLGFMRQDFGTASNNYGQPLLVARHSYGLRDYLTLGVGVEADNNLVNLVPRAVIGLARLGVLNILGGESHDHDLGWGTTLGVGYQFQSRYVNYQLGLHHNSRGYRTLANRQASDTSRLDCGTGISAGTPSFGTVSLNGSYTESYAGKLRRSLGVSYSRSLAKTIQFSASMNSSWGTSRMISFFTGLTFFPTNNLTTSAMLQTSQGSNKETLSMQRSLPAGKGIGYLATVERERAQGQTLLRANPLLQVNGPYGSYTVDLQGQLEQQTGHKSGSYLASAAGALLYAGGHFGPGRPVSSSFAIVQVEGLSDVKVLLDNQEVAHTNASGIAYISSLQPYQENKISFDDHQIAANYLIKRYKAVITPGLFGGECIYFPAARIQAYGGHLLAQDGRPLEYATVTLRGRGLKFSFTTLSGGEFYFENLVDDVKESGKQVEACGDQSPYRLTVGPGMYAVTVVIGDSVRHFNMLIPTSDAIFVPLGTFWLPDPPKNNNNDESEM